MEDQCTASSDCAQQPAKIAKSQLGSQCAATDAKPTKAGQQGVARYKNKAEEKCIYCLCRSKPLKAPMFPSS